jgi:His-Xaa-Ser system radical SAM maturase HxsC
MRQTRGVPRRIRRTVIAKVNVKECVEETTNYLLSDGSLATSAGTMAKGHHGACGVEHIEINVGDVLQLEPNGLVTVVFEANSSSNAINITDVCDNRCIMCPQSEKFNVSKRHNLRILELASADCELLGFTGGEPTCDMAHLVECLRLARRRLPKARVDILTNGVNLASASMVREIVTVGHPDLWFCVALHADLDTLHDWMTGRGSFYKTLAGIEQLARHDQMIELRVVITKANCGRLPAIAEFVCRNFPYVAHVALMGLELEGRAGENCESLWMNPLDYQRELAEAVSFLRMRRMAVSVYNHPLCVLPVSVWESAVKSISAWKDVFLTKCSECLIRDRCGGMFASVAPRLEPVVHAIA